MALEECQTFDGEIPMYDDWWNIMDALRSIMHKERKLRMDFTKHEFMCEGLPFNIDFVLLKWGQRIYTNFARIARKYAKRNGFAGVKFLCYFYDVWAFRVIHEQENNGEIKCEPKFIVVSEENGVRFSTPEESREISDLMNIL